MVVGVYLTSRSLAMHLPHSHQQIRKRCLTKLHYGLLVRENGGFVLANEKAELGPSSFKVSGGVAFIVSISNIINPQLGKKCRIGKGPTARIISHREGLVC